MARLVKAMFASQVALHNLVREPSNHFLRNWILSAADYKVVHGSTDKYELCKAGLFFSPQRHFRYPYQRTSPKVSDLAALWLISFSGPRLANPRWLEALQQIRCNLFLTLFWRSLASARSCSEIQHDPRLYPWMGLDGPANTAIWAPGHPTFAAQPRNRNLAIWERKKAPQRRLDGGHEGWHPWWWMWKTQRKW